MNNFSKRLQALIDRNKITKYRLAKDLHVPHSTLMSWMKGRIPRRALMEKLAAYFNVEPAWLQYGDLHYVPNIRQDISKLFEKICAIADKDDKAYRRIKKLLEYWCVVIEEEMEEKRTEAHKILRLAVDEKMIRKPDAKKLIKMYSDEEEITPTNN